VQVTAILNGSSTSFSMSGSVMLDWKFDPELGSGNELTYTVKGAFWASCAMSGTPYVVINTHVYSPFKAWKGDDVVWAEVSSASNSLLLFSGCTDAPRWKQWGAVDVAGTSDAQVSTPAVMSLNDQSHLTGSITSTLFVGFGEKYTNTPTLTCVFFVDMVLRATVTLVEVDAPRKFRDNPGDLKSLEVDNEYTDVGYDSGGECC